MGGEAAALLREERVTSAAGGRRRARHHRTRRTAGPRTSGVTFSASSRAKNASSVGANTVSLAAGSDRSARMEGSAACRGAGRGGVRTAVGSCGTARHLQPAAGRSSRLTPAQPPAGCPGPSPCWRRLRKLGQNPKGEASLQTRWSSRRDGTHWKHTTRAPRVCGHSQGSEALLTRFSDGVDGRGCGRREAGGGVDKFGQTGGSCSRPQALQSGLNWHIACEDTVARRAQAAQKWRHTNRPTAHPGEQRPAAAALRTRVRAGRTSWWDWYKRQSN